MDALGQHWGGALLAGLFGLCVGSFANVVIYRSPREGLSVLQPARSFCPGCKAPVAMRDNVPVLSWLLLRGRCRSCRAPIAWRYPAVELLVGALFAAAWWLSPPVDMASTGRFVALCLLAYSSVAVTLIDLEHFIIPDVITYPGVVGGLLLSLVFPTLHVGHWGFRLESPHASALMAAFFGLLAGGGSLFLVGRLGNLFLRRKLEAAGVQDAMGWGDVKWMAFAGTLLGALSVLSAILVGCVLGALAGIAMKLVARARGAEAPVGLPFGPFLSLGILVELVRPQCAWLLIDSLARPA
ncbi:MAG TPA: prepilin peptidase [Planctomycetota bacterium]|nr:prepilin peptidase [Planctomycetota bacterium]